MDNKSNNKESAHFENFVQLVAEIVLESINQNNIVEINTDNTKSLA